MLSQPSVMRDTFSFMPAFLFNSLFTVSTLHVAIISLSIVLYDEEQAEYFVVYDEDDNFVSLIKGMFSRNHNDNDHDNYDKNGHILPTGQWYAPSAINNDALIMPEYTRACKSMPGYARVCQSMPEYAIVFQSMPEYARVCQSMPEYARVCQSMPE